ncbi:hypothetical protein PS2_001879 [Malus domestica]
MKISMSRESFIHVAKFNLAWKNSNLARTHRKPKVGVLRFSFLGVPMPLSLVGSCSWVQGKLIKGGAARRIGELPSRTSGFSGEVLHENGPKTFQS